MKLNGKIIFPIATIDKKYIVKLNYGNSLEFDTYDEADIFRTELENKIEEIIGKELYIELLKEV